MADFLSRLAERSLGRAALARPVIAPLFATGPGLAAGADAPEDGPFDAAGAGLPTARDMDPTSLRPVRPGPLGPEPVGRVPETRAVRPAAARFEEPPARPSRRVEETPAEEMRPRTADDPGPMRTPAAVRSAPTPRALLSDREPARPRRHVASLLSEAEPPAPIVRISIGRIEVRAVASPPVAARPAPARTEDRLSLGEYLKGEKRRR
jgi:hypothetical protein